MNVQARSWTKIAGLFVAAFALFVSILFMLKSDAGWAGLCALAALAVEIVLLALGIREAEKIKRRRQQKK
jgi:hypothetical protein